jgi:phosphatidylserine/phosphatidylglycerophosphate/cardiolipin synthase-like enzyme
MYIFTAGPLGERARQARASASTRGSRARVGGRNWILTLSDDWQPLRAAGGEARFFNPVALNRFGIRNHRKLLVCDDTVAFVGGSTSLLNTKATA